VRGTGRRAGAVAAGEGGSGGPAGEIGGKPSGGAVGSLSRPQLSTLSSLVMYRRSTFRPRAWSCGP
jgi:hypothetical protein